MARVWRDGQSRKVHIYRLLTTVCKLLSIIIIPLYYVMMFVIIIGYY